MLYTNIVTNNPLVKDKFSNVDFLEGTFEDVLIKSRDLIHQGYELVSYPLGSSIRMNYSPYRSIIIGIKKNCINFFHVETIENSIMQYRKLMDGRKIDYKNSEDYARIDMELLKAALNT
ncbi:MAG: GrdX family protein [Ruminiclostridium sp.]|nr:GrdX family protein [Ruminiclostridium sp.]